MASSQSGVAAIELPAGARIVARGLGFTEAPISFDAESILVSSVNRGDVYRVWLRPDREPVELFEAGGGPNGLALRPGGDVFVAQNGGTAMPSRSTKRTVPSIQKWSDGRLTLEHHGGVSAPSDCVFGPDGLLWFTDPADHQITTRGGAGHVRSFDPDTGELRTRLEGLAFPNGLAFDTDGALYVAETSLGTVSRYRFSGDSMAVDGWVARLPSGHPDGIALDRDGSVWVAGSIGHNVLRFDASGTLRENIHLGEGVLVSSLCFAGEGLSRLCVTTPKGGAVLELFTGCAGLPLPAFR